MTEHARLRLRLYVVGGTARAEAAMRAVDALVAGTDHEVEVVDVTAAPEIAEHDRVLATPCLDRVDPPPRRRVIGDLADTAHIADVLGLPRQEP